MSEVEEKPSNLPVVMIFLVLIVTIVASFFIPVSDPSPRHGSYEACLADCEDESGYKNRVICEEDCMISFPNRDEPEPEAPKTSDAAPMGALELIAKCQKELQDLTGSGDYGPGDCWPVLDEYRKNWKDGDCEEVTCPEYKKGTQPFQSCVAACTKAWKGE